MIDDHLESIADQEHNQWQENQLACVLRVIRQPIIHDGRGPVC